MDNILVFAKTSFNNKKKYFNEHLPEEFQGHEQLRDIILRLLEFEPEKRMSVEQACKELTEIRAKKVSAEAAPH